jgi:hypothetical protein
MANQQTSSGPQTGQPGSNATEPGGTSAGRSFSTQSQGTSGTGVRDATYDLISVVYHALQGAETYKMYEKDAERSEDSELAQFFRQTCEEEKRRAQQGKELLARHLQKHAGASGGQQLQSGSGSQQHAGSGAQARTSSQQSAGSSNQQTQAVPGDQYGNTQSTSAGKGQQSRSGGGSQTR